MKIQYSTTLKVSNSFMLLYKSKYQTAVVPDYYTMYMFFVVTLEYGSMGVMGVKRKRDSGRA